MPRPTRRSAVTLAALAGLSSAIAATAQPQILALGVVDGVSTSQGVAISADGEKIVGNFSFGSGGPTFVWMLNNGFTLIDDYSQIGMRDISGDGQLFLSFCGLSTCGGTTKIHNLAGTEIYIENFQGSALDSDENSAAGLLGSHAARWTSTTGANPIVSFDTASFSRARDISESGHVVVGYIRSSDDGRDRAFRWTVSSGLQILDTRTDGETGSIAEAVSGDGTVVTGSYDTETLGVSRQAFRYAAGSGWQLLGTPAPGYPTSVGNCINVDGTAIAGYAAGPSGGSRAMYWTESLGMVDLNVYLPSIGVDLDGWDLRWVNAISADGTTLTGVGFKSGEPGGAFLITGLPGNTPTCPPDVTGDNAINLADLNLVLANFGQTTTDGDTNNDGQVNLADLNAVLAAFGTDCP